MPDNIGFQAQIPGPYKVKNLISKRGAVFSRQPRIPPGTNADKLPPGPGHYKVKFSKKNLVIGSIGKNFS
jgi:hypothetical protein